MTAGKGGDGKESSITGSSVVYAAGGGGGTVGDVLSGYAPAAGGSGIGGNGGDNTNVATGGADGRGAGGGGCGLDGQSGKGGDGTVIVRISIVVDGPLEKPTDHDYVYDGTEKVGVTPIPSVLTVTGENTATNVRDEPYKCHVELEEGFVWTDGTRDAVDVSWRILPRKIEPPQPLVSGITYDGLNHVTATNSPLWTYKGVDVEANNRTNSFTAGEFHFTADLVDTNNYRWDDGSAAGTVAPQTKDWTILPAKVDLPDLPQGVVYGGTNVVAVTNGTDYGFADGSVPCATNAGRYAVIYQLRDPLNHVWSNDGSSTNQTYYWEIARLPVEMPPVPGVNGRFVYNGKTQIAATNSIHYAFTSGSTTRARDVRTYFFEAELNGNYSWLPDGAITNCVRRWSITQADNEITSLKINDWKLGDPRATPSVEALFGANTATYAYGKSETGPWVSDEEAVDRLLGTNGTFYVKATIAETTNWKGAEKTKRFLIYKSFDELFTDYVDLEFPSHAGAPLENFAVLVKVSEALYRGFSYARCGDGEKLGFFDMTEGMMPKPLPYEVDTWNPSGESLVWVKVPVLQATAHGGVGPTKIRMYWHLKPGMAAPGPDPEQVWSDYAGVWHFNESINATAAPTALSHDSTGHGYDAQPITYGASDPAQMVSVAGMIGNARTISSTSVTTGGNNLVADGVSGLGTNFFFSGWVKADGYALSPWILAGGDAASNTQFGVAINATDRKKLDLYGAGAVTTPGAIVDKDLATGWVQLNLVVSGRKYWLFPQATAFTTTERSGELTDAVGEQISKLIFGCDPTGAKPSLYGKVDEFRVRKVEVEGQVEVEDVVAALKSQTAVEFQNTTNAAGFARHDWIVVDGVKQNWWKTAPRLSKTRWDDTAAPASVTLGEPAIGTVSLVYRNLFNPAEIYATLPTTAGNYVACFTVEEEGFNTLSVEINFTIVGHSPYSGLGKTEEGRILLANDDDLGQGWEGENAITNQAYWVGPKTEKEFLDITWHVITNKFHREERYATTNYWTNTVLNATYWTHSGESTHHATYRPYLLTNSVHTLETTNHIASLCGGSRLWHLEQIRIGNLWQKSLRDGPRFNYLPWSPTSCAISSNGAVFAQSEVGNLMMRNTTDARIYSPCYTNGIGTIYFDAVNFDADSPGANQQLVVEVATNVIGSAAIPTDENCCEYIVVTNNLDEVSADPTIEPDVTVTTNWYVYADWKPVKVVPYRFERGVCKPEDPTEVIALDMQVGGLHVNFYRLVAQLDYTVPARFRIRRVSMDEAYDNPLDRDAYAQILLDNIICSKPRDSANTMPDGWHDPEKRGKQALGVENAWSVPFPSINDRDIYARAVPVYHGAADTITKTTMFYRERYLKQRVDPSWKSVVLNPYDGFRALSPLELTGLVGDVEFYFESELQAPYYQYVDYSGMGYGVPGFTEELTKVTDKCTLLKRDASQSLGTDWYVRLREGRSDWERLVLKIEGRDDVEMELVSDHIWRGYLKTVDGVPGGVRYRVEPQNWQEPGSSGFAVNTNFWYARDDVARMPVSAILRTDGTTNSWARIPCDGTTGYLMFQVDDSTKSISIVHADYQDFDQWNDSYYDKNRGTSKSSVHFFGNSTEDERKSGVSPRMQQTDDWFTWRDPAVQATVCWPGMPSADPNWAETFTDSSSFEYPDYETFPSSTTIGGWKVGPGMYVYQWYKHGTAIPSTGGVVQRAVQLQGCGQGWLQFPPNPTPLPRGVGTVSFCARLAQFIALDDDISFAELPTGVTDVRRNYGFMALAAFDTKKNQGFSGNASVSLFAYYRVRRGAYEVRLEQTGASVSGSAVTGPSNNRRLTLYRWTVDGAGKMTEKELGHQDITFAAVQTDGASGKYTPFYISCSNEAATATTPAATVVKFGIYHSESGTASATGGFSATGNMSELTGKRFYSMVYRDTSDLRLSQGTYGVLSANCDGVFLRPCVMGRSVSTAVKDKDVLKADGTSTAVSFPTPFYECRADIADEDEAWNTNRGRMETFWKAGESYQWGVRSRPMQQSVLVQVAPRGEKQPRWETVDTFTFDSFGGAGDPGLRCTTRLDRPRDLDIRLKVAGEVMDPRTDIIVDDVSVTQWRGCDYGDPPDADGFVVPKVEGSGWCTNFVFSSAWVVNYTSGSERKAAVRLSPKRTAGWEPGAKACSIRSPLMDGAGSGKKRGIGLGMIAFNWRNAQANARILVQIATNDIRSTSAIGCDTIDDAIWTTVDTVDFSKAPYSGQRSAGHYDCYLGLHGVKGMMRLVADPEVVRQVSPTNWLDETLYGEVDVTHVMCRDEPPVDLTAWWGWNMQTTDYADRQYLVDNLRYDAANGLSLGLNNSTDREVDEEEQETYRQQMPFVQTPSFLSNTVGEVTFRARTYEKGAPGQYAEVALYGASFAPGTTNLEWRCSTSDEPLQRFIVSNDTYTTYTYKTKPGEGFKAFRLGVTGVKDVEERTRGPDPTQGADPVRVLIDEVLVSEAIRPEVGFRYCVPVRNGLLGAEATEDVFSRDEQPIMGDAWSVQAEIEVKLLPDEVDLVTHKPRVFFHWFVGDKPWGYQQWKDSPKARSAELALCEGETMVFRGNYVTAPDAVVMAEPLTATYNWRTYQYAAEVEYWDNKGNCITGVLGQAEWTRPEWYAPLDLNRDKGGNDARHFAAYNILETVSPGRAWINEVNLFDGKTPSFEYPAEDRQYVEIAVPITQSLRNWKLYEITQNQTTNLLCVFGQNEVAESKTANSTNNYVFVSVQSPAAKKAKTLDPSKWEVDGTWEVFDKTEPGGELDQTHPVGFRLIRPSGIVAHEVVLEGTNIVTGAYADRYSAERLKEKLNASDPEQLWYVGGNEYGSTLETSLGVTNLAEAARVTAIVPKEMWRPDGRKTPGAVNDGQVIPAGYAIFPSGDMVIINATVAGPHLSQTVGGLMRTTEAVMVATPKGGAGTNILYHLDNPWFEITVAENGVTKATRGADGFVFPAGKDSQESVVTVTASVVPRHDLAEKYGLTPENPYTDAVFAWLEGGKTLKGDFAYPGSIDLPKYRNYAGNFVTNLTLTETYWFDIDPTGSNWCYRAGTAIPPHEEYRHFMKGAGGTLVPVGEDDPMVAGVEYVTKTNIQIGVFMSISNEVSHANWPPYVLRGLKPGTHSQQYARRETNVWNSVNFKMTGDIQNGMPLRARWVPLRYFVFKDGSFDANNLSIIEIPHPHSPYSLSVNYGWQNYPDSEVFYSWSIDPRIAPVAIEVLCPTNTITW